MINKHMIHMDHTFVEIDHEIISMVILLLPLIQEICYHLHGHSSPSTDSRDLLSLTIDIMHKVLVKLNKRFVKLALEVKSVVR